MRIKLCINLIRYLRRYLSYFIMGILTVAAGIFASLYLTILIGEGINLMVDLPSDFQTQIGLIIIKIMVFAILSFGFQWVGQYLTNQGAILSIQAIRRDLASRFTYGSLAEVYQYDKGNFLNLYLVDVEQVSEGLLSGSYQLISGILTMLITLGFMFRTDWILAILVLVLTPFSIKVATLISKGAYRYFQSQSHLRSKITALTNERILEWETVQFFGLEEEGEAKLENYNQQWHKDGLWAMFYSAMVNPTTRMMNTFIYGFIGIWGGFKVLSGQILLGDLAIFLGYSKQYAKPFNEMTSILAEFQQALSSWERILKVMEISEIYEDDKIDFDQARHGGDILVEDLSFGYTSKRRILKNLNLKLAQGGSLAIIGTTGCGKSTLLSLLLGFYQSDTGSIYLGNHQLNEYTKASLGRFRGAVLQKTWIFSGSIFENIAYGKEASMEEVVEAAKKAYAHEFISKLPNGYEQRVGKNGHQLSAGEEQLICIARVMLVKPEFLILDEATSHLDTLTESLIQKNVDQLMKEKTTIIVAHRLATIQKADHILVMSEGRVVEEGNHQTLIQTKGLYSKLVSQMK